MSPAPVVAALTVALAVFLAGWRLGARAGARRALRVCTKVAQQHIADAVQETTRRWQAVLASNDRCWIAGFHALNQTTEANATAAAEALRRAAETIQRLRDQLDGTPAERGN